MIWTFDSDFRQFTVLGVQGDCEYAKDQYGSLYYRFTKDAPEKRESWKVVANAYRIFPLART